MSLSAQVARLERRFPGIRDGDRHARVAAVLRDPLVRPLVERVEAAYAAEPEEKRIANWRHRVRLEQPAVWLAWVVVFRGYRRASGRTVDPAGRGAAGAACGGGRAAARGRAGGDAAGVAVVSLASRIARLERDTGQGACQGCAPLYAVVEDDAEYPERVRCETCGRDVTDAVKVYKRSMWNLV